MSERIDNIHRFIKKHSIYSLLLGIVSVGLFIDLFSAFLIQEYGYSSIIIVFLFFLFIIGIMFLQIHIETIKRTFPITANRNQLKKKYKGLVVSVSLIREPKQELIDKINAVKGKDINNIRELNKLYILRGIGQTFRAVIHHRGELQVCWLLYTKESKESMEVIEHFIKKFCRKNVKIIPIKIENSNNIRNIHKTINEIYIGAVEEHKLPETEIIIDITGGTTPMSCAIILACVSSERCIEYIEQGPKKQLMEIEHL